MPSAIVINYFSSKSGLICIINWIIFILIGILIFLELKKKFEIPNNVTTLSVQSLKTYCTL